MNLNPLRCEVLCIANKHFPTRFDYQLTGCSLRWSTSVKYLKVQLNSKLIWHCAYACSNQSYKTFNLLRWHLYACPPVAKCRAFCSLVIPILEYASQVWNPHTQKNISQLEAIQLCAACWICGSRFNHSNFKWSKSSSQCRSDLNWPKLSTCQNFLSIPTVHDILHKCIALRFSDYFTYSSSCIHDLTPSPCTANPQL